MACLQHFNHKEQIWNDRNIKASNYLSEWSWHVCSTLITRNKYGIDMVWWEWQVDDDYDINVTRNQNDEV